MYLSSPQTHPPTFCTTSSLPLPSLTTYCLYVDMYVWLLSGRGFIFGLQVLLHLLKMLDSCDFVGLVSVCVCLCKTVFVYIYMCVCVG